MKNFAFQNRVLQRDQVLERRVLEREYCIAVARTSASSCATRPLCSYVVCRMMLYPNDAPRIAALLEAVPASSEGWASFIMINYELRSGRAQHNMALARARPMLCVTCCAPARACFQLLHPITQHPIIVEFSFL